MNINFMEISEDFISCKVLFKVVTDTRYYSQNFVFTPKCSNRGRFFTALKVFKSTSRCWWFSVHSAVCFLFLTEASGPHLIPCWIVRVVTSNQPCTTLHPFSKGVVIYSSTLQRVGWIWMDVCLCSFCLPGSQGSGAQSSARSRVAGLWWGRLPAASGPLVLPALALEAWSRPPSSLSHTDTHMHAQTHMHTHAHRHTAKLLNQFVYLFCLLYPLIRRLLVRSSLQAK